MENHRKSSLALISTLLTVICLSLGQTASAQTTTGAFVGTITDASGAAVPKAKVTITEQGTGARHIVYTNPSGQYAASLLPIGTYSIQAEQQGFSSPW